MPPVTERLRPRRLPSAPLALLLTLALAACGDSSFAPGTAGAPSLDDGRTEGGGRKSGSITIILGVQPEQATDIPFTFSGAGKPKAFTLDADPASKTRDRRTFGELAAGTYTVQVGAAQGPTLIAITCSQSIGGTSTFSLNVPVGSATINLAQGDSVTCTFFEATVSTP
jgi:hypothetical protein